MQSALEGKAGTAYIASQIGQLMATEIRGAGPRQFTKSQESPRRMSQALKLIAQTPEDLTVMSSLMQDTTVQVGDMAWLPAEERFALVGNRYRWEKKGWFRRPKGERVRTAVHFSGVNSAQITGIDLEAKDTVLDLLDMEAHDNGVGVSILLNFANGASVRLSGEVVDAVLTDLSEPWEARARPRHQDQA